MTTMADWVAETKRLAYGSLAEQMNIVSGTYTAGDEVLELELSTEGVAPGTIVSSGLNTWWVKGVNPTTNTLYVVPNYEGSPGGNAAIGDMVTIRPRATDWFVFTTLNRVIKQMSSPQNGLYQIADWNATVDLEWDTYTIPTEAIWMMNLLRVRAKYIGSTDQWQTLKPSQYQLQRDNAVVRILVPIMAGSELQFVYKSPFVAATALTDDAATVMGFPLEMLDIPPLGAAAAILRTTEGTRNQLKIQGDPRRASEVTSGSNMQIAREFDRIFKDRVDEEAARLMTQTSLYRGV